VTENDILQALGNKRDVPSFITVHEQQVSQWRKLSTLVPSSTHHSTEHTQTSSVTVHLPAQRCSACS